MNAPFSWPNSSLSTRPAESAAQLTVTSRRSRRGLDSWIARATSSLPVPVSPVISTLVLVAATIATRSIIRRRPGELPTISDATSFASSSCRRYSRSFFSCSSLRLRSEMSSKKNDTPVGDGYSRAS